MAAELLFSEVDMSVKSLRELNVVCKEDRSERKMAGEKKREKNRRREGMREEERERERERERQKEKERRRKLLSPVKRRGIDEDRLTFILRKLFFFFF